MGCCTRGKACAFAHGNTNVQPLPDFFRTRLCPEFMETGTCRVGDECAFAHGKHELRVRGPRPVGPVVDDLQQQRRQRLLQQTQGTERRMAAAAAAPTMIQRPATSGGAARMEQNAPAFSNQLRNALAQVFVVAVPAKQMNYADVNQSAFDAYNAMMTFSRQTTGPPSPDDMVHEDPGSDVAFSRQSSTTPSEAGVLLSRQGSGSHLNVPFEIREGRPTPLESNISERSLDLPIRPLYVFEAEDDDAEDANCSRLGCSVALQREGDDVAEVTVAMKNTFLHFSEKANAGADENDAKSRRAQSVGGRVRAC
eukprot:TRINITY_DN11451_c0_g1_i2.p1 TRINITY_DN11451_c0_g1~~TRINITY_DN11451_c0_g1_i2.p1  ORF type:complete len:363 (-),score=72.72 TRINITY_DN11451_c0_g1_i2:76-1005(-)